MRRILFAIAPFVATTLAAQQPALVGMWEISYSAGARIENGFATEVRGTGVLMVTSQGDSLVATLVPNAVGDTPARPPAHMAAKAVKSGPVTFIAHSKAKFNFNGVEEEKTATSTWVLEARGDSLTGTVTRSIEGMENSAQPPKPVSGTRKAS